MRCHKPGLLQVQRSVRSIGPVIQFSKLGPFLLTSAGFCIALPTSSDSGISLCEAAAIMGTITANPLRQDVRSHTKCLLMCAVATVSTFQYGKLLNGCSALLVMRTYAEIARPGLDYALVGGFLS